VKKKVKVSKELACQLQVIITDEDHDSLYEETFENWEEEMSSEAYRDTTDDDDDDDDDREDEDEEEEEKKRKKNKKYTPFLNPDFNKPISNIAIIEDSDQQQEQDEIAPITISASPPTNERTIKTDLDKSLPVLDEPVENKQTISEEQPPLAQQHSTQQVVVTGLKRLLSIGKKNKPVSTPLAISKPTPIEDTQYHVLRIFSGNINVGALFSTVAVTPDMNADQLLKLALQKFHIPLLDNSSNKSNDGIEYYLTVKSMDSGTVNYI
jgi:hypothetical protein